VATLEEIGARARELADAEDAEIGDVEEEADEAARAEGETPAPRTEGEEPPHVQQSSLAQEKEREKRLKSEDTRHENALKKVWGEAWEEHAYCPLCLGQGFVVPIPAGEQPDEIWEAIKALSGRLDQGAFRHPDELVTCGRCDGYGQVATGAKAEHTSVIPCAHCDARGYFNLNDPIHKAKLGIVDPLPEPVAPMTFDFRIPTPAAPAEPALAPPPGWMEAGKPGVDTWGRWPGHTRHGIDPAHGGW
jgi:hypothetical protein